MTDMGEKLTFEGSHGASLAARLDRPDGAPRAYALFAHCFTCSKDVLAASRIASALASCGIAVLRFDFTGLGHSGGEFASTNFSSNVEDLVRAADYLRKTRDAPKILIGHSLGGAAVLAAAARVPEAVAVATIGAPADPEHVVHLLAGSRDEIERSGEATVKIGGRSFTIRKQFLDDISTHTLRESLSSLRKALLVFHAPRDEIVGIENAGLIFAAAKHPKSFISLDDADHLLTRRADALYVAEVLAAWASRYIGEAAEAHTDLESDPDQVVVRDAGEGTFPQDIVAGHHRLRADEPESVGGTDTGPTPYDLLLAGLGACTSMTVRLYAERKGWPLRRTTVRLSHDRIHAEDCESCETKEGRIDRIQRRITFEGSLDADQRTRLLQIADKCPVHRTLTSEIRIETSEDETT
jgi:uncharacterized OsmC-like protein/alpha/beta superfamily hydrolase